MFQDKKKLTKEKKSPPNLRFVLGKDSIFYLFVCCEQIDSFSLSFPKHIIPVLRATWEIPTFMFDGKVSHEKYIDQDFAI